MANALCKKATAAEIKDAGFASSDFTSWPTRGDLVDATARRGAPEGDEETGEIVDPRAAAIPNVQSVLDRLGDVGLGSRIAYRAIRAIEAAIEWPTIRGYVFAARRAERAVQARLAQEQAQAVAAKYDDDEFGDEAGETPDSCLNEGEKDVAERSGLRLPDYPCDVTLAYWGWLRFQRNRLAKVIAGEGLGDEQFYAPPTARSAVIEGIVRYQSQGAKDRDVEDAREHASLDAQMTPTMRAVMLDAAKDDVSRAKAWLRRKSAIDVANATQKELDELAQAKKSLTSAEQRLAALQGGQAATVQSDAAEASKKAQEMVQSILDVCTARTNKPLTDAEWALLPTYAQYDCWAGVAKVLAKEVANAKRGRLAQLFNESDAMYLQRSNRVDGLMSIYGDACDIVAAYRNHWQVLHMAALREGTPLVDQQRDGLRR